MEKWGPALEKKLLSTTEHGTQTCYHDNDLKHTVQRVEQELSENIKKFLSC